MSGRVLIFCRHSVSGLFSYFYSKISFVKSILTESQLAITIKRLAHQILENNSELANTVLIGLQPRGIYLSDQVVAAIKKEMPQLT